MCYTLIGKHAPARQEDVERTPTDVIAAAPAAPGRRGAANAFAAFWRGLQEQLARPHRKEEESVS
jgi:hypothetical protein